MAKDYNKGYTQGRCLWQPRCVRRFALLAQTQTGVADIYAYNSIAARAEPILSLSTTGLICT